MGVKYTHDLVSGLLRKQIRTSKKVVWGNFLGAEETEFRRKLWKDGNITSKFILCIANVNVNVSDKRSRKELKMWNPAKEKEYPDALIKIG